MIYFFKPYSFEKKLFKAYDECMLLIPHDEDWGCLLDGDMAFLHSDFGHEIQDYIDKYPETGLFTCYGSRCPYGHQMISGIDSESDSLHYIYENTVKRREQYHGVASDMNRRIAGHLMVIQKKTWLRYREQIAGHAENANIQAVDTAISDILIKNGEKIRMMEGLQVFHYYRQFNMSEKHILSDKLTVIIRTHNRPGIFTRCIESVKAQSHKNIDIIVGVDNDETFDYAAQHNPTRIVRCEPRARNGHQDFPANGYISQLVQYVDDGFILILDDDNYIADPQGVEKLMAQIDKEWCLYIIRYRYPDGRLFPNDSQFKRKSIENGGIDWASHVFHARFKNFTQSRPVYNGDFYWISELAKRIKTQKWIDLALVHTDMPGTDGKSESEIKNGIHVQNQPVVHNFGGTVDAVWVLGSGSAWNNNEMRYSMRSVADHFPDLRKMIVVGEKPAWMTGVLHIAHKDDPKVNKDCRMMRKLMAACKHPDVSENFVFLCDDMVLLEDTPFKAINGWHNGPIIYDAKKDRADHCGTSTGTNISKWYEFVYNTGNALKERGLPDMNYDRAHAPQPVNKAEFQEVFKVWDMELNNYTVSNIYLNSSRLFAGANMSDRIVKLYSAVNFEQIGKLVKGKKLLNYNDTGLNADLKRWLENRFQNESACELTEIGSTRSDAAGRWIAGGCDYDTGVRIFSHFAPRNQRLIRWFEIKRGTDIAAKKLRQTLNIWLK